MNNSRTKWERSGRHEVNSIAVYLQVCPAPCAVPYRTVYACFSAWLNTEKTCEWMVARFYWSQNNASVTHSSNLGRKSQCIHIRVPHRNRKHTLYIHTHKHLCKEWNYGKSEKKCKDEKHRNLKFLAEDEGTSLIKWQSGSRIPSSLGREVVLFSEDF